MAKRVQERASSGLNDNLYYPKFCNGTQINTDGIDK